jgi:ParB-like chromosome segregation protein Spo0J
VGNQSSAGRLANRTIRNIEQRPITKLRPYGGNARTHSKRQIRQLAKSIEHFGFTNPVLVDDDDTILAGHGRVAAAKLIGMTHVPTVRLSHLSAADRKAYVLTDNKLALNAGWDQELLATELQALVDLNFEVERTGFSLAEVDLVLDAAADREVPGPQGPADAIPPLRTSTVSRRGDLWRCGQHRLICGDARELAIPGMARASARSRRWRVPSPGRIGPAPDSSGSAHEPTTRSLRHLYAQVDRRGSRPSFQLARRSASGLFGLHPKPSRRGLDRDQNPL